MPTFGFVLAAIIILHALTAAIFMCVCTFLLLYYYWRTCSIWRREGLGKHSRSFIWRGEEVIKTLELGS